MPEPRKNLPPSLSRSVASRLIDSGASASSTRLTVRCSASARTSGPGPASRASVPENLMNAMLAIRCSGSGMPGSRYSPSSMGNRPRIRSRSTSGSTNSSPGAECAARRRSSSSPSSRGRTASGAMRAAVAALTTISPASAAFSASAVDVAPGPRMSSSRVGEPTRNRWMSPEWSPTDIFSESRPTEVGTAAAWRSAVRISTAASHACSVWSGPVKRNSNASPPNFSSSPPRVPAIRSIGPNTRLRVSTISSAPIRPRRDSFSVSAVKPETSANTSVPSTTRHNSPGVSSSHASAIGGTCRRRSVMSPHRPDSWTVWNP